MTREQFIEAISAAVIKYSKRYGYGVPSAIIAQACLESAYGTSEKAKHHNYFGMKYRPGRLTVNSGTFTDGSKEQNPDGSYRDITDTWYSFDSLDSGVEGYFQFISIPNYSAARAQTTAYQYLMALKAAGYATSQSYVNNLMGLITSLNLTKYDKQAQASESANAGIDILQFGSFHNTTRSPGRKIEWLVLHYTAGTSSKQGSARNIAGYFSRTSAQASADFVVDQSEIVQYNPSPENAYCWSVGGSKYSRMTTSEGGKYYGKCRNNNSVSIEMCSDKRNTATLNASDTDWYLTERVVDNAAKLTAHLAKMYNIPLSHIIMHHHVTGKVCPNPWCVSQDRLSEWERFKTKVAGYMGLTYPVQKPISASFLIKVVVEKLRIREKPSVTSKITGYCNQGIMYTIVEQQGNWGRLKSGRGWIYLPEYTERV